MLYQSRSLSVYNIGSVKKWNFLHGLWNNFFLGFIILAQIHGLARLMVATIIVCELHNSRLLFHFQRQHSVCTTRSIKHKTFFSHLIFADMDKISNKYKRSLFEVFLLFHALLILLHFVYSFVYFVFVFVFFVFFLQWLKSCVCNEYEDNILNVKWNNVCYVF